MQKIYDYFNAYKKTWILAFSFVIPAIILLYVYKLSEIYPFGKLSLLIMDLNTQYIDFMIYLKQTLKDGTGIIYSWTKAGGSPLIDLFAYYLSSPLNFILIFFPIEKMYNAVLLLNIIKIGLCGITFTVYLKFINSKWDYTFIIFSMLYALSTYCIAYSMCLMWLDAVIMLPLVMIGIEKIIKNNKCSFFIITYSISLLSNFYTCFMITIFSVIYFVYRFLTLKETNFIKKFLTFIISGITSALMCSWMILPSLENMTYGKIQKGIFVSSSLFTRSAETFIKQIFPAQCNSITYNGGPNIFCGIFISVLFSAYYFNNRFSIKDKILTTVVTTLFIISFYINKIDVIWHMFQTPTWFPCRYAFLFIFFIIFIAFKSLKYIKEIKNIYFIISTLNLLLIYIIIFILFNDKIPNNNMAIVGLILIVIYFLLLLLYKHKNQSIIFIVVVFMAIEMILNSLYTIENLNRVFKYNNAEKFEKYISTLSDDINTIKNTDTQFYRIEKDFCRTENDSMSLSYNGIAHYSSSYNSAYNSIMKKLGLEQSFIILDSSGITPVFNALFNIKYYFTKNADLYNFYEKKLSKKDYDVMYNPYALAIGYLSDSPLLNTKNYNSDYLNNQNILTKELAGIECFEAISFTQNGNSYSFKITNSYPVYFSIPKKQDGIEKITVNNKEIVLPEYNESCIFPIGSFSHDDSVTITLKDNSEDFHLYFLNTDNLQKLYETKSRQNLNVIDFDEKNVECTITAEKNSSLFTTINYNKNWKVFIDGKPVKTFKHLDAFIGVEIPQGTHTVSFNFVQKSFYIGITISLITLLGLIFVFIKQKF